MSCRSSDLHKVLLNKIWCRAWGMLCTSGDDRAQKKVFCGAELWREDISGQQVCTYPEREKGCRWGNIRLNKLYINISDFKRKKVWIVTGSNPDLPSNGDYNFDKNILTLSLWKSDIFWHKLRSRGVQGFNSHPHGLKTSGLLQQFIRFFLLSALLWSL